RQSADPAGSVPRAGAGQGRPRRAVGLVERAGEGRAGRARGGRPRARFPPAPRRLVGAGAAQARFPPSGKEVSTRCACGLLVVPTAMLLSAPAFAASTYIELLKERLPARVAERNDPRVLDELEVEYLGC